MCGGNVRNTFTNLGTSIGNAISNSVKSGINGVINLIERTINSAINLINGAIGLINNIPGVNIGRMSNLNLPRLAKGGVLTQETMFVGGEYSGANSNPEIVAPQNIIYDTVRSALEDTAFHSNNEQPIRVQIYWGVKNVLDEVIDGINEKTRRTGKAVIKVGEC